MAADLMQGFADATGLAGTRRPQRYLWTDAFAVCNFLGLHERTGEQAHLEHAIRLVDQVHHVLGRHREDDAHRGWISGLDEEEGERHPTRGGLRIGKKRPERAADEPFDARAEWERDGQYLHYLTQWMHALHRVAGETGNRTFDSWGIELAQVSHAAFARRTSAGAERLAWKMSIDLRRVLVPSMGQHDALDSLTAYRELQGNVPALDREIAEMRRLAAAGSLETDDGLGIGALLCDAYRLTRLAHRGGHAEHGLVKRLLSAAAVSLGEFAGSHPLSAPAASRLAFRELGLAIGLHGIEQLRANGKADAALQEPLDEVATWIPMAAHIDEFWSEPDNRRTATWTEHRHINDVMLATSLEPSGYLGPPQG